MFDWFTNHPVTQDLIKLEKDVSTETSKVIGPLVTNAIGLAKRLVKAFIIPDAVDPDPPGDQPEVSDV